MSRFHTLVGSIPDTAALTARVKVPLFDGSFDTGFRIVGFEIAPSNWSIDPDMAAILSTEELTVNGFEWDWGDNRQKGWAAYQANGASAVGNYFREFVDDIVVEDLYINAYSRTNQAINYKIVLEKINITEWEGALAIVRNSSQG